MPLFKQLGCSTELSHLLRLLAVDAPPSVSLDKLKEVLNTGRAQGRWGYEEDCLAEP